MTIGNQLNGEVPLKVASHSLVHRHAARENRRSRHGTAVEEHIGRRVDEVMPGIADQLVPIYRKVLETGEPVWQYDSGSAFTASPAVAQGRLVISSLDGVVYCFG